MHRVAKGKKGLEKKQWLMYRNLYTNSTYSTAPRFFARAVEQCLLTSPAETPYRDSVCLFRNRFVTNKDLLECFLLLLLILLFACLLSIVVINDRASLNYCREWWNYLLCLFYAMGRHTRDLSGGKMKMVLRTVVSLFCFFFLSNL